MISAIATRHYITVMEKHGFSSNVVLANSGLNHFDLFNPVGSIEPAQYRAIIRNILNLKKNCGIGFEMAEIPNVNHFGVISHAAATSKTLRDSHNLWVRFGKTLGGTLGRLEVIEETSTAITLIMTSPAPTDPVYQFCVEELLGLLNTFARPLVDKHSAFIKLSLSYSPPTYAKYYNELFNCPVEFDAPQTTVKIYREWFDSPVQTHDEEFHSICIDHCRKLVQRFDNKAPIVITLENLLNQHLSSKLPLPKFEEAAALMRLSPRTFRRRLNEAGTSYRTQIDYYRAEQAQTLLSFGTVTAKEVAYLLGFNEQSAFLHAFKAWTGRTIREYRGNPTGKPVQFVTD